MYLKKFLLVLTSCLSMAFFMACQSASAPPITEQNPGTTPVENSGETTLADQAAYKQAVQLRDLTFCDKIENQNYKSECQKEVEDSKKLDEALTKLDSDLCNSLSNEDKKKACQITVEGNKKEEENAKKREEEIKKMYEELNKIMNEGDIAKCDTLKDQNLIDSCKYNIVTKEALDKKDASLCQKIVTEEGKKECQNAVESAA